MKNLALIAFAVMILLGWTALAGGMIAALAGEPTFVSSPHDHRDTVELEPAPPALLSGAPECPQGAQALDASVPCKA